MIVLSIGAVSAQDADNAVASTNDDEVLQDSQPISGTASGGVDVVTENPWSTSGELSYDIASDAKTIKSADVYVNVYGGSAANTYGANANVTITTDKGPTKYNEALWTEQGSTNGTVYPVNDHTTKCYSDYMIHYNITSLLTGLNGTKLKINVDTFKYENKTFDGRIKLIALVLAYNDDSNDETVSYWINDNQLWTKSNVTIEFDTAGKSCFSSLTNVVLSSGDGSYKVNNQYLGDAVAHKSGNYYQYNQWDVTKLMDVSKNTSFNVAYAGTSSYGSIKNALSVLRIYDIQSSIGLTTEYSKTAFAGTNNTLNVTVDASKSGKYLVRLFADGKIVDEAEVNIIDTPASVFLTDPTIRPVDDTTVKGANNPKVNYTVELLLNGATINSTTTSLSVLYNGNLGKDLTYPGEDMEPFAITINGDIVIDVKDVSTYLKGDDNLRNRTDNWTVALDENSNIVKSFIYIPYNWFDPSMAVEDKNMFNAAFNGNKITPINLYRDQSNLGYYGSFGYGVLVYDVTGLVNKSGINSLFLSRANKYPAIYPSVLVYMYNTTNSNYIKEVYINNGADLLTDHTKSLNNFANRTAKADSTFNVDSKVTSDAKLYILASNALPNYGDIVFNGKTHKNVWNGESGSTAYKEFDVTGNIKDTNSISFIATDGNILALQQIMVLTKNLDDVEISLASEYANTAYAGTNNAITITIEALKEAKFNVALLADGKEVNKTEINLVKGKNTFVLIDPTIRDVNASTVNGAVNDKINYTLQLSSGKSASINIPILYNGNLGKDLAYPKGGIESFLNITVNGDIVINIKDVSSKLTSAEMNRTDVWTINLDDKSDIVKSFIYVPYNWFNINLVDDELNMFNTTFNGVAVTPIALYKDQSNLGSYGKYRYGVLVYDVTGLINKTGDNKFVLNKKDKTPSVYPSIMVYMYNTTGSAVIKNIYISNGADLLSTANNVAGRTVKSDSTINVDTADYAELYVFASNAMSNYGNIVFNGETYSNVWSGASYATQVFDLDVTNSIKNTNNISFVATGSTILALQQIIVTTQKASTVITAPGVTTLYNTDNNLVATLKDSQGNAIANANVTFVLNGNKKVGTTNANGQVTLPIPSGLVPTVYDVTVSYDGDDTHVKSSIITKVIIKKADVKLTAKKKTFKAKVKTKKYAVTLKDNKGKVMKNVKLTLNVKGKTYKANTNANGKAIFKIKNLKKKGKYTAKITYKATNCFNKSVKNVRITVKK